MKRVFMSAVLLASLTVAKAQKNTVLVGGNVAVESKKEPGGLSGESKTTTFEFNPTVGYQFNNSWTAGVVAGIGTAKVTYGSTEEKVNTINAGPFIRYTKSLSNIFSVYGQLEGKFGGIKYTYDNSGSSSTSKGTTADINLFPALFVDFKNSFGLNFSIGGITYNSIKPKNGDATNTFNFNFGKVASIGISKNFGKKK